jgi:hypothetical protein
MRNRSIVVVAVGLFCVAPLFAQQPNNTTEKISQITEFKPLTLWRKAVIGGAYYTDPMYVSNLRFSYGYNIKDIPEDVKGQLPSLIKSGVVTPAIITDTGNARTIKATGVTELEAVAKDKGIIFISNTDNLLGQRHSTNWVVDLSANK